MRLLVNEVFSFKGSPLRVLHSDNGTVTCINIEANSKDFPFRLPLAELEEAFLDELATRIEDPNANYPFETNPKQMEIARHRFESIKPALSDEGIFYKNERAKLIKNCSELTGVHKFRLYTWLRLYWKRGLSLHALLPDYQACGGRGKAKSDTSKMGRPREKIDGRAPIVDEQIKRIFRRVTDKYILTSKNIQSVTQRAGRKHCILNCIQIRQRANYRQRLNFDIS